MAAASTFMHAREWTIERRRAELFHGILAEQPHYLVPSRLLRPSFSAPAGELYVNPDCWFSWQGQPPRAIATVYPLPAKFRQDFDMVWVYDRGLEMARPFWTGPRFRESIRDLQPRRRAERLKKSARDVLYCAGIVQVESAANESLSTWERTRKRCAKQWRERGYCAAEGLLHPFHVGSLRRYYRHLLRTGRMTLGDSGSPLRYVAHNESVAKFFHRQLAGAVHQVTGVPVKPSYVYVSSYQNGADLPIHTDRVQCEYSITMLVDHTPELTERSPCPLYLETARGTVPVHQHIGEALFYRGREIPHFRTRLPECMSSTSIFFHYVDATFKGSLD